MRDPRRIREFIDFLKDIWEECPDQRFNQLVHNLQWQYSNENNGTGRITVHKKEELKGFVAYREEHIVDLYNLEDDDFLDFLKQYLEELQK